MNNNGWIPLWRKTLDNDIWKHDHNAWRVFETLLLLCDQKTGIWEGGRIQLSERCFLKPSTIYKAIKRLEKSKMVTLSSNNKYTKFYICNIKNYSSNGNINSNNQVTTREQPSNTLTIIKNKELRNNIYVEVPQNLRLIHEKICKLFNKNENTYKLTDKRKKLLKTRLKDTGEENILKACEAITQSNFHMGDNDRGWEADPYWCLSSIEKAESWSGKYIKSVNLNEVEF